MINKQRIRALFVAYSMALSSNLDGSLKNPWTMASFVEDLKREEQKVKYGKSKE